MLKKCSLGDMSREVITWLLNRYTKCSYTVMEDIKHISSGSTDHNNLLLIFASIAVKLEIVGPTFSTFIHFYFRLSQQYNI